MGWRRDYARHSQFIADKNEERSRSSSYYTKYKKEDNNASKFYIEDRRNDRRKHHVPWNAFTKHHSFKRETKLLEEITNQEVVIYRVRRT